jgi:metallophosphoesterase (TIGR00282 family)
MLREGAPTGEQRDQANHIYDAGLTLEALINDILDLSRIEAGVIEIESAPFALRDCLQEIVDYFPTEPRLLRPINYPPETPGNGSVVLETAKGRIGVIQAQGRSFIQPPLENPFLAVEAEVARLRADGVRMIVVEIHAETTSEKIAMGRMLDGTVSLVVGTHTHVQTADEAVFSGGTGYLTDAGMCGPEESVLGRTIESVVWRFKASMPTRFPIAKGPVRLCGVIVDVDAETGSCLAIKRFSLLLEDPPAGAREECC